jgi:hypothetical protein
MKSFFLLIMIWLACIISVVCPPIGIIIIVCLLPYISSSGYRRDLGNYYTRRKYFFKKKIGF